MRKIKLKWGKYIKSITCDNGSEFSALSDMQEILSNTDFYYCHPYSSFERGSNENANRIIRRFYPKGTDFHNVTQYDLDKLSYIMNNTPRKILQYYSPAEMFDYYTSK